MSDERAQPKESPVGGQSDAIRSGHEYDRRNDDDAARREPPPRNGGVPGVQPRVGRGEFLGAVEAQPAGPRRSPEVALSQDANVRYRTIVADPPWDHSDGFAYNYEIKGRPKARRVKPLGYPVLSTDAIAALPVGDLVETDARLFLWTTSRYLPAAIDVLRAWGFTYKQLLVWRKTNGSPFGGPVAPVHAEFVLVANHGRPSRIGRFPSSVFESARTTHSAKPEGFLDTVEAVSPGPYLELFARRNRLGWDTWGNESLGTAELVA